MIIIYCYFNKNDVLFRHTWKKEIYQELWYELFKHVAKLMSLAFVVVELLS